ncbi:BRCA1-A complex subunit RAP80 isoform X3 [Dromiciops gliroides]|uniref:BRCA1-A complex subunit RAP80 isoform X3 n=1 Tax=Dromiciops gliroides TaxID=33562 RepID=UPI001CC7A370|nr:BRCA1-A complex subunit RAP80 isoform X3 [Dromiciops gliroides]
MPRRKKKVIEATESERLEENEILEVKKVENSFIVISDSDEEPGEENGLLRTRTMQQLDRAKCAAKRKITQMTEEEQFALALKMSEQEAQQVNDQVEEEEELLRKAIAESLNNSQVLFAEDIPEEDEVMTITSSSTALSPLTSKRSPVIARGSSAEEITVCPETQLSPSEVLELEREEECLSTKERPKAAVNENIEKEMSASIFSAHIQVSCPMCDQGFPPTEIELHAMYCNGLVGEESRHSPVLTRKRKQDKHKSDNGREIQPSLDIDKTEKCYLCKSLIPFKEYPRHVDLCLQIATDDQGNKLERDNGEPSGCDRKSMRQRNTREGNRNEGRLLSLLEQSEHKSADINMKPESSGEAFRSLPSEMEKADGSRGDQSSFNLNDSPIKSFVSISEAKDCLVDFKKQLSIRPGNRKRTKASRGKRRKS